MPRKSLSLENCYSQNGYSVKRNKNGLFQERKPEMDVETHLMEKLENNIKEMETFMDS